MDQNKNASLAPAAIAARKASLLGEGEMYRIGLVRSKAQLRHAMRPDALFHGAIAHAGGALRSHVDAALAPTGLGLRALMPVALSLLGLLRRRGLLKPALGAALVLAGVAGFFSQRRQRDRLY